MEEEVIVWQGKGITGSGAVDVQPLWTEEQQKIGEVNKRDSAIYMDFLTFGQPSFQSDSWWLFCSCFLSFYSSLQICHEGKTI